MHVWGINCKKSWAKILFSPCTKCSCLDEKDDISFLHLIAISFITFLENDSNSDSLLLKIQLQYLNEIVYLDIDTYYDQKGYDELKNWSKYCVP